MHSWPAGSIYLSAPSPLPKDSGRACYLPQQHPLSGVHRAAPEELPLLSPGMHPRAKLTEGMLAPLQPPQGRGHRAHATPRPIKAVGFCNKLDASNTASEIPKNLEYRSPRRSMRYSGCE